MIQLSYTSKMPCASWSLPAENCITGSKLSKVKGSVCEGCYAKKGTYRFRNVKLARARNLAQFTFALSSGSLSEWIREIVQSIKHSTKGGGYFRWFDSGDLQGIDHLRAIVEVCKQTPEVKHWLPTHEKSIILEFVRKYAALPENLIIRISAAMVGGAPTRSWEHTSTVVSDGARVSGYVCPSSKQGNTCGDCRACWDKGIANVAYIHH